MGNGYSVLEGIRVVEAATFVFGPAAGTVMSDFGAEVVHIEHPVMGDVHRYLHLVKPLPECEQAYCWIMDGRNKQSVGIDLKHPDGREVVDRLLQQADVFITNYHPSVLEKFRLRYEDLAPHNPRLVYAYATGYGEEGTEIEKPGYDATAWWARSGLMDVIRPGDGGMGLAVPAMGDHASAMSLFGGIMLALYAREQTGHGTKVSSSLMANGVWANSIFAQAALCGAASMTPPVRSDPPNALINHYRTGDGRAIYLVTIQEEADWPRICEAIGRPELTDDPRFVQLAIRRENAAALTQVLDAAFAEKSLDEWRTILDRHDITFGIVARIEELPDDEQMIVNGVFTEIADADNGPLRTVDSPITLLGVEKVAPRRAPEIGEHTIEVLQSLGYSADAIKALCDAGAVRTA